MEAHPGDALEAAVARYEAALQVAKEMYPAEEATRVTVAEHIKHLRAALIKLRQAQKGRRQRPETVP